MDTPGIASDSLLGAQMVKKALDLQASNVAQILEGVTPPSQAQAVASKPQPVAPDPDSRLGQNIDVMA